MTTGPGKAALEDLVAVLQESKRFLTLPANDYSWSSWGGADAAVSELDSLIADLGRGNLDRLTLEVVFAATGPMQEVSLSSGWAQEFVELAARFDVALRRATEGS